MSEKDKDDLRWALQLRVDMIALSFVRSADDIRDVHQIMDEEGMRLPVIAKIEKPQAVENLDEIIRAFDGVMVARGDLGVELPLEEVPLVQKRAVEIARRRAKPVIVATQVLESMIENAAPDPRRGLRRRQRRARRRRRAHALRRDQRRQVRRSQAVRTMARIIENTEDHGLRPDPPARHPPALQGRRGHRGGRRDRRAARREVPRHLHASRRLRAAARPGCGPGSRCSRSRRSSDPSASSR